ncbi:MAG: UPF0175 family protein [Hydrogenothermaceae bacterium]
MKVVIDIPDELKLDEKDIKTATIIKLYELGKISSGKAAKILGIRRVDFIDLLGKYNVQIPPYIDARFDLHEKMENLSKMLREDKKYLEEIEELNHLSEDIIE